MSTDSNSTLGKARRVVIIDAAGITAGYSRRIAVEHLEFVFKCAGLTAEGSNIDRFSNRLLRIGLPPRFGKCGHTPVKKRGKSLPADRLGEIAVHAGSQTTFGVSLHGMCAQTYDQLMVSG